MIFKLIHMFYVKSIYHARNTKHCFFMFYNSIKLFQGNPDLEINRKRRECSGPEKKKWRKQSSSPSMQTIRFRIYSVSISLHACSHFLRVEGVLNYIHAEVLDPISGLSKWLPESISARWVSESALIRWQSPFCQIARPSQKLCQIMFSCPSQHTRIAPFEHLF